jgi:hypothetical protein
LIRLETSPEKKGKDTTTILDQITEIPLEEERDPDITTTHITM